MLILEQQRAFDELFNEHGIEEDQISTAFVEYNLKQDTMFQDLVTAQAVKNR